MLSLPGPPPIGQCNEESECRIWSRSLLLRMAKIIGFSDAKLGGTMAAARGPGFLCVEERAPSPWRVVMVSWEPTAHAP
jgi:hypothetical protein